MMEKSINLNGILVRLQKIDESDYVSLQDIANGYNAEDSRHLIRNWMRATDTIEYLGLWEGLENENFNVARFGHIKNQVGRNSFLMSPTKWVKETNAIGIIPSKAGRYSKGTFAQRDIALHFCYWLSPPFQLYLIREFDRLKTEERLRLGDPFNIKRFLTSGNYSLLASSIIAQMDERLLTHPQPYKSRLPFAAEADMINEIVFGQTAQAWRIKNADKPTNRNQRDYASVLELTILNNLEFLDAMLMQWEVMDLAERKKFLQEAYDFQYPILARSQTIKKLQGMADKASE